MREAGSEQGTNRGTGEEGMTKSQLAPPAETEDLKEDFKLETTPGGGGESGQWTKAGLAGG